MILIRVDLPAPLSPSRPSTSPLRRCRLMSRSAVVGPNDLVTCSTRSTSSSARDGPTIFSAGVSALATARSPAHAGHGRVEGHRDQDRQAEGQGEEVGAPTLDVEPAPGDPQETGAAEAP